MKFLILGLVLTTTHVWAQTASWLSTCYEQSAASKFCARKDGGDVDPTLFQSGWCCDASSTDAKCTEDSGEYECTLDNLGQMDIAIW